MREYDISERGSRIRLTEKLAYGCGDTASNFVWGTLMSFLTYFYTDIYGLEAGAMALLFFTTRILDGISDFAMGAIADRTNTRAGKFRPYLLWFSIPLAVAFVLTFTTPPFEGVEKLIYAFVTYNILMLIYTAINIPYSALSGVMTSSAVERAGLNSYRMGMAMLGGLLVNALTIPMIRNLGGGDDRVGYFWTTCIFGVIIVILFTLTFLGTHERIVPKSEDRQRLVSDIRMLLRNLPWLILFLIGIFNMVFTVVRGSVTIHYYKYVLGLAGERPDFIFPGGMKFDKISTLLVLGSVFFIVGALVTPWFVKRFSKRTLYGISFFVNGLVALPLVVLGEKDVGIVVILLIVGSISGGVNATLFWTMIADTADYAEAKFQRRATGIIFSATTAAQKLGMGFGGAVVGLAFGVIGYVANVEQSPQTVQGLKYLMSLAPAIGFFFCAFLMIFYPLDRISPRQR